MLDPVNYPAHPSEIGQLSWLCGILIVFGLYSFLYSYFAAAFFEGVVFCRHLEKDNTFPTVEYMAKYALQWKERTVKMSHDNC